MAKNISLLGGHYQSVPSVLLPQTGGGMASFVDVTGTTAAAGDVVSGKVFFTSGGVQTNGSLVIQHYYTGSSAPASSLGVNGDIYLKT